MIYVLFGPPGVGKTYIGQLLSRRYSIPFIDADTLIDAEEKQLLRAGKYDQFSRDNFINKLIRHVGSIIEDNGIAQDVVVAEAFTKEKNRKEFKEHFNNSVCYLMVSTPENIAIERAKKRMQNTNHVINIKALELIWKEFETPKLLYITLANYMVGDEEIINQFGNLVKLVKREK